ncbi:MAG: hypothetical protein FJ288_18410 [Planctomycetes bacterium]|nr:hypothetical protein [Planctomycetota bacterium]
MLRTAAGGGGNLPLDIGPRADGSVPREASGRLRAVGRWIARYGEALYGPVDRIDGLSLMNTGNWTLKGKTAYFWASRWPDTGEIVMGRWEEKVKQATLLTTGPRQQLLRSDGPGSGGRVSGQCVPAVRRGREHGGRGRRGRPARLRATGRSRAERRADLARTPRLLPGRLPPRPGRGRETGRGPRTLVAGRLPGL